MVPKGVNQEGKEEESESFYFKNAARSFAAKKYFFPHPPKRRVEDGHRILETPMRNGVAA